MAQSFTTTGSAHKRSEETTPAESGRTALWEGVPTVLEPRQSLRTAASTVGTRRHGGAPVRK